MAKKRRSFYPRKGCSQRWFESEMESNPCFEEGLDQAQPAIHVKNRAADKGILKQKDDSQSDFFGRAYFANRGLFPDTGIEPLSSLFRPRRTQRRIDDAGGDGIDAPGRQF